MQKRNNSVFFIFFSYLFLSFVFYPYALGKVDYYKILGVKKDATKEEISKSYRKKALEYHPDKNPGKEKKFQEITAAYDVLSDPEKRAKYDLYGDSNERENDLFSKFSGGGSSASSQSFSFSFGNFGGPTFIFKNSGGGIPTGNTYGYDHGYSSESIYGETGVEQLSESNFEFKIKNRESVFLINFYSPRCSHCVEMKNDYVKISNNLKGLLPVGAVNCMKNRNICANNGVQSYPHIVLFLHPNFSYNDFKNYHFSVEENDYGQFVTFTETKNSASAIMNWIGDALPSAVDSLNDDNFYSWITDNSKLPKVILFSNKKKLSILYKVLSQGFSSLIKMAVIFSNQKSLLKKFKLADNFVYPSILYVQDTDSIITGEWFVPKLFTLENLSLSFSRIFAQHRTALEHYGGSSPFRRLTKNRFDNNECSIKDSQICFILAVYGSSIDGFDASNSQMFLSLKNISEKFKRDPIKFTWIYANTQDAFLNSFGLSSSSVSSSSSLPSPSECKSNRCARMIAYRPKRKQFALLDEILVERNFKPISSSSSSSVSIIEKFIESVLSGIKNLNVKVKNEPTIVMDDHLIHSSYDNKGSTNNRNKYYNDEL